MKMMYGASRLLFVFTYPSSYFTYFFQNILFNTSSLLSECPTYNINVPMEMSFAFVMMTLLTLNIIQGQYFNKREPAKCPESRTPDGLLLANCSGEYPPGTISLNTCVPQDLSPNIQVLDFSQYGGNQDAIVGFFELNALSRYSKLQRIIIKRFTQFNELYFRTVTASKTVLKTIFKDLSSLEYLEFSSSSLKDIYPITFPRNLKTLKINDNLYTRLSVQMCAELVELDANQNYLQSVPTFHIPDPPLTTLRLKGNPLKEMTILDIAPLCELTLLELEFPPGSHYLTEAGACQCSMLKYWVQEFNITGVENVKCAASKQDCSKTILGEAGMLRKKCPILTRGTVVSSRLFTILKFTFFSILLLLLLATIILYIIRHFHLKEYWEAHHRAAALSIKMEEEEEEDELREDELKEVELKEEASLSESLSV